jgi:hypothetical protein
LSLQLVEMLDDGGAGNGREVGNIALGQVEFRLRVICDVRQPYAGKTQENGGDPMTWVAKRRVVNNAKRHFEMSATKEA